MNVEIINKLKELKPILKEKYGIEEFAVFGSVARGEDREDSDVDLGLFDGMKTFIKNRIKKDLIYV